MLFVRYRRRAFVLVTAAVRSRPSAGAARMTGAESCS